MKYSNTSRLLNVIFHGLIVLIFGALGVFFGLVVAPYYLAIDPLAWLESGSTFIDGSYTLWAGLGIVGLTIASVSGYGLYNGIRGILNPRDDEVVVKGFNAFIVDGYIAGIFCLLNAVLYFDGIKGSSLGFAIIVMIILFIGLMIASNIPMVKLYDNKDQTPLLSTLLIGAGIFFAWAAVVTFFTLVGSWSQGVVSWSKIVNGKLLAFFLAYLVSAALLIISSILLRGGKAKKLVGHLSAGAILLAGGAFVSTGVLTLVYSDKAIHLCGINRILPEHGNAFGIIAIIVGALVIIGAVAFDILYVTGGLTKKKHKA